MIFNSTTVSSRILWNPIASNAYRNRDRNRDIYPNFELDTEQVNPDQLMDENRTKDPQDLAKHV